MKSNVLSKQFYKMSKIKKKGDYLSIYMVIQDNENNIDLSF